MNGRRLLAALAGAIIVLCSGGCQFGKVAQGRAIAYDATHGLVTMVSEQWDALRGEENYVLPAVTVKTPLENREMGPPPNTGKLLAIDVKQKRLVYFDAGHAQLRTIDWRLVRQHFDVFEGDPRIRGGAVPAVNRGSGTVTLYMAREHTLIEIAVPPEYLDQPDDIWKAGDEIRYYYKDPRQALRMMNVSRTDLSKGEH